MVGASVKGESTVKGPYMTRGQTEGPGRRGTTLGNKNIKIRGRELWESVSAR